MNDESCRTEPVGIEWEFPKGAPELVAHLPGVFGTWEVWSLIDERGDLEALSPLQREVVRAYLKVALRRLDESEPAVTTGMSR